MPQWLRAFGIRIYSHAVFGIDQEIEKLKDTDKTSEEDREMVEEQSAKCGTGPAGLGRSIPRNAPYCCAFAASVLKRSVPVVDRRALRRRPTSG